MHKCRFVVHLQEDETGRSEITEVTLDLPYFPRIGERLDLPNPLSSFLPLLCRITDLRHNLADGEHSIDFLCKQTNLFEKFEVS